LLYLFQVAYSPSQPVNNSLLIFVNVAVGMGDAMFVHIGVIVVMIVRMVVVMVCHGKPPFHFPYHTLFFVNLQALRGDMVKKEILQNRVEKLAKILQKTKNARLI